MTSTARDRALAHALALGEGERPASPPPPARVAGRRRVAMGDPQAPLPRVLEVLDRNDLLTVDGWLRPDVQLVSMGDHFDWGGPERREEAAHHGVALLRWLAAHPADQVVLLLGNHDLSRVSELGSFDDARFARVFDLAAEAWRGGDVDRAKEAELLEAYPEFPSAEHVARDLASFTVAQRELVLTLLAEGRWSAAVAADDDLLLTHAGLTVDDLALLGLEEGCPAPEVAGRLDAVVLEALASWEPGSRFALGALHRPASRRHGMPSGVFVQHAAHPERLEEDPHPPRRRYDARLLPRGLTQVVGHVRDGRQRERLGPWVEDPEEVAGPLRSLVVEGEAVRYQVGVAARPADGAAVLFTDGRMGVAAPEAFELLDLDRREPWA